MYNIYLHTIYLCRYASKNYTCSKGHLQTDLRTLYVIKTFREGWGYPHDVKVQKCMHKPTIGENCDILYSSLEFPHAASSREKVQGSLVVRKHLLGEKLKIRTLKNYRFLSKIKLHSPIEIVWSLNFRASIPTLYVKNKMAEASLLPQNKGGKFFLGHGRVFLNFRT